jgi:hypothetical protein
MILDAAGLVVSPGARVMILDAAGLVVSGSSVGGGLHCTHCMQTSS